MSILPTNEKYVMFLNPTYFKKRIFKSIYKKIIKKLENKGIVLFNISSAVEELKRRHKNTIKYKSKLITFDDNYFPNVNTLYINLFSGQYYNDNIYNKKKVEKEREMLFLLAGKLGVKSIRYETEVVETTITKINSSIKAKAGLSANFSKSVQKNIGTRGEEYYINRGAPVYLKYDNLQEVEKNIEEKMNSNIFDFKFYKNSPKLENFVYKRYEFKMERLAYNIETEDISDISFAVKAYFSYFMDYGIDISFDKNISYNENVHYTLEFFSDDELKREFGKKKRDYIDKFYSIREYYDLIDDKDKAVHLITEYVMEYAKNYHYIIKDQTEFKIHNFLKHIQNFIKYSQPGSFEGLCHSFQSTSQIKNWIDKEFLNDNMEIINEINECKKDINTKQDNVSVILPYEKKNINTQLDKQLDKQLDTQLDATLDVKQVLELDLQSRLELLAKEHDDISGSDLELKNIIENCNAINKSPISFEEDEYFNNYMKKRSITSCSNLELPPPPVELSVPILPPQRKDTPNISSEPISNIDFHMTNDGYENYLTTCTNDDDGISEEEQCIMESMQAERIEAEIKAMEEEKLIQMEINRTEQMIADSFGIAMQREEQKKIAEIKRNEEELMAKLEELKNRPPIIPLSRTISITSVNSECDNIDHPLYPPPPPPANSSNSSDV